MHLDFVEVELGETENNSLHAKEALLGQISGVLSAFHGSSTLVHVASTLMYSSRTAASLYHKVYIGF